MSARRVEPTKSLLQGGAYTKSEHTNIRETFAKYAAQKTQGNVQPIKRKTK